MKYIDLPKDKKGLLRQIFDVSGVTVWAALTYQTNSPLAKRIRSAALANGGVVKNSLSTPEGFMPNCQTEYTRDDGKVQRITHTFTGNVKVVFDNDKCDAVILRNEELVKVFNNVAINGWADIVFEAQTLSELTINQ